MPAVPDSRNIKDPIHGLIEVSSLLVQFIDSEQFQRLRGVKQLGTTSHVWPGGSHTRFEHSLGVAHLARQMVKHLQMSQPELGITDREVNCVEIAGLCHDLGHGPWSHVWDSMFIPRALPEAKWTHEQGSEMMFDELIKEKKIKISKEDQDFVKALIRGDHARTANEKPFLFEIVANSRNGLDVDKIDYIHRDSHMTGDSIHLSPELLVKSARVLDNQICYNIKNADQLYDLFNSRFKLHKSLYNHKSAKAVEYMIIDGLLAAEPYMKIADRIRDPKKFLFLTDSIMETIRASEAPELQEARDIFKRIPLRDLYKCVDSKIVEWQHRKIFEENVTPAKIVQAALALSTPSTPSTEGGEAMSLSRSASFDTTMLEPDTLKEADVIVDLSVIHFGQKDKNPLDKIRFYSKRRPNESRKAKRGDYSGVRPECFAEVILRIYTKNPAILGLVQAGYRAVLAEMASKYGDEATYGDDSAPMDEDKEFTFGNAANTPPLSVSASTTTESTPAINEPPTTPKPKAKPLGHSRNGSLSNMKKTPDPADGSPFDINEFNTVPKTYRAPGSPSRSAKKDNSPKKTSSLESLDLGPSIGGNNGGFESRPGTTRIASGSNGSSAKTGGGGNTVTASESRTQVDPVFVGLQQQNKGAGVGLNNPFSGGGLSQGTQGRQGSPSPTGKRPRDDDDQQLKPLGAEKSVSPDTKRRKGV
ncbi:hypothetical protein CPB83DRAFT_787510 [Crepidotus variabilis]|uniref:HD/PDEase domain-containing protein n=1 Tax=Crepidotus variabilis TaxID=179855 RepID=A0A9P6EL59_9AGAR|nr:hypothetical protein CPB83DRAFT_787510 [Crepidotus variabilis]